MIKILQCLWTFLLKFQKVMMILSSIFVVLALNGMVLFRYILKIDLFGLEELVIISALWLYFMGASFASYERSHISADIINVYIKNEYIKLWAEVVKSFISILILLVINYWSLQFMVWGIGNTSITPVWEIPMYITIFALFLCFLLMMLYTIVHFIRDLKKTINY